MATRDEQESAHIPYLVPVIKDFVRTTFWSHQKGSSYWQQVNFSDNFSERKKLSCLHYGRTEKQAYRSVNNQVNLCTLQWAEGLQQPNFFIGLRIPKKFLQSLAFLIFIQRHFPSTITWKLFDFYWHKEEIFLKRTPGAWGGEGYSLQQPIRGDSAQK